MRELVTVMCALVVFAMAGHAAAPTLSVEIQVAPATIVLKAPCNWVTIHADIAYSSVQRDSVKINGLNADSVFADSCGNLVAKIAFERITELVSPPTAEIVLTGVTTDGVAFGGSEIVRVK
ncbi:MAG: hypothetical protein R6V07_11150 [Armatimonadota bacterium]